MIRVPAEARTARLIRRRPRLDAGGTLGAETPLPLVFYSIGYVIGRACWNRGFDSEALGSVLDVLRRTGLRRAYAVYDVDNPASGRVMAKAGMRFWGRLPKAIVHPRAGSDRRDVYLYELGLR